MVLAPLAGCNAYSGDAAVLAVSFQMCTEFMLASIPDKAFLEKRFLLKAKGKEETILVRFGNVQI